MLIRAPAELGAMLRDQRQKLKIDQSTLAKRIGVSRQWMIKVEQGHARAELGLVLRALDEIGIRLDASTEQTPARRRVIAPAIDINAIVAKARKKRA